MTRADHVSGSDRVFEAVSRVDPEADFEIILNLQGDLPAVEPETIAACLAPLRGQGAADRHHRRPDHQRRTSAPIPTR